MPPYRAALGTAGAVLLLSSSSWASPQWNLSAIPGMALVGRGQSPFDQVLFWGALRGDLLLTRNRATDFGFGPYVMFGTAGFGDARASAGASLLVPWNVNLPLVFSAGALTRDGDAFGVESAIFWGIRSYNFRGTYNLAGGVLLGAHRTFGSASDLAFTLGIQVDLFILAMPVLLLGGAVG